MKNISAALFTLLMSATAFATPAHLAEQITQAMVASNRATILNTGSDAGRALDLASVKAVMTDKGVSASDAECVMNQISSADSADGSVSHSAWSFAVAFKNAHSALSNLSQPATAASAAADFGFAAVAVAAKLQSASTAMQTSVATLNQKNAQFLGNCGL